MCWMIYNALVAKYNGKKWEIIFVDETAPILRKIWGSSSNDLFACGLGGIIYHFDGTNWTRMESGTTERLDDIWGSAPDDVYACGGEGSTMQNVILHYDGIKWQSICELVDLCNGITSKAIWGSGKDNIYIETGRASYQGNLEDTWEEINIRNDNTEIRRISGSSSFNVFQVGPFGLILHYNGKYWHRYGLYNKPHGDVFKSVKVIGNHVYVVGDTETSSRGIIFKGTYY